MYLHDPRCICREAKTKTRRKNKDDTLLDAIFWPIMPYPMVAQKMDTSRQPHVIQPYVVPVPQNDVYRKHDEAVYSMWMHFVDFCVANTDSNTVHPSDKAPVFAAPDVAINAYTKKARLPIFRQLSASSSTAVSTAARTFKTVPVASGSASTTTTSTATNSPAASIVSPSSTSMLHHYQRERINASPVAVPILPLTQLLVSNKAAKTSVSSNKNEKSWMDRLEDEFHAMSGESSNPMASNAATLAQRRNRESFDSLESYSTSNETCSRRNSIDSTFFPSDGSNMCLDSGENDSDARTSPETCNSTGWGPSNQDKDKFSPSTSTTTLSSSPYSSTSSIPNALRLLSRSTANPPPLDNNNMMLSPRMSRLDQMDYFQSTRLPSHTSTW